MPIDFIVQLFVAELVAFVAFFAYPAFQYISLKLFARNEGKPELWYLPDYGFRLVVRNIPGNKVLSEINHITWLRRIIPASAGASVASQFDAPVFEAEELFFIFPGTDLTLAAFRLVLVKDEIYIVLMDRKGTEKSVALSKFEWLVSDYIANVENFLNFDIKIAKRVEISARSLQRMYSSIQRNDIEQSFPIDRVRNVG